MVDRLRVGLVGPSWFAETVHLAGLDSHPRAQFTAVCGRSRENAEAVAARHGNPAVFTDYRSMLSSGLLDAVVVAVPDHLHLDVTLAAVESGLHVLCEKPLARTAHDARRMLDAATAAGVVHMTMMTWRWMPVPAFAKRLVEDGYLGRVRSAHFSMQSGYDAELLAGWRFDPEQGTGILGDLGSHMIDLARCYVGEIDRVCARLIDDVPRQRSDGTAMASLPGTATLLVDYAAGATGTIDVSGTRMPGEGIEVDVRLHGDEASLRLQFDLGGGRIKGCRRGDDSWSELTVPADLTGGESGGNPSILDLPGMRPFTNLAVADRLFVDAVLDGIPAEPTLVDGWRVCEVIDAAVASDRELRWVNVRN